MSARLSDAAPPRLVAVLGPTNTGKTHLAVERMLGHASASMTLDTYADLFDDDLDAVATRLNDQMPLVALPSGPQPRYARPQ